MERRADSHKGENGKIAVIGGSRTIHGAPVFSALAAEASGVDLVFLCLPACHEDVAKQASLNVQVHAFSGNELSDSDTQSIVSMLATMDCAVIGPGISRDESSLHALKDIIGEATCPLVLDATALQPFTLELIKGKQAVLTPHLGELERMELEKDKMSEAARESGATIVLKGMIDQIVKPDNATEEVSGGNAGLTVGGTGDVLAGLIGGLIAQGMNQSDAAHAACILIKQAGTELFKTHGYAYTARDVINLIPHLLHTYAQ